MSLPASNWLADEFAKAFSTAFAAMTGEEIHASLAGKPPAPPPPDGFRWQQLFSAGAESLLWLETSRESAIALGREVLRTAGIEGSDEASEASTFVEVIQQALSGAASAISRRVRKEVICAAGSETSVVPADQPHRFQVNASSETLGVHQIIVVISAALAAVLDTAVPVKDSALPPPVSLAPARAEAEPAAPKTMALLMEVELPVGVSFGRAQMRLKDVIKLTTGSIVELNRSITEPVEIIVNNCVIARGEVVVVDGNYGVRIQQIISREERLRTLY
ncbi:MAG: flagellar motor switch protein FliN [Bryobacterales bacterium]|nr:flagellar motor switch protein FliN [Bryobacterales bacterium]